MQGDGVAMGNELLMFCSGQGWVLKSGNPASEIKCINAAVSSFVLSSEGLSCSEECNARDLECDVGPVRQIVSVGQFLDVMQQLIPGERIS